MGDRFEYTGDLSLLKPLKKQEIRKVHAPEEINPPRFVLCGFPFNIFLLLNLTALFPPGIALRPVRPYSRCLQP